MNYYQKYQKYKFKYLNLLNQSGGSNNDNNANVTATATVTTKNNENENDKIKRIIDDYNKNSKISEDLQVILDLKKKITDEKDSKTFDEILKIKKLNINDQNNLLNMGIYNRKIKLSQNEIDENKKSKDEKVKENDNLKIKLKELNDTKFNEIIDSKIEGKEYYNSLIKYIILKYTQDNKILNIDSDLILFIASHARNSELEQDLFEILKIKQYDNKKQSEILSKSRSDRIKFLNQSGGVGLKRCGCRKNYS